MVLGCIICHEPFDRSSDPVVTNCGHIFDRQCLNQWMRTQGARTCPTCRVPIPENGVKLCYFTILSDAGQSSQPTGQEVVRRELQNQARKDKLLAISQNLNSQIQELMRDSPGDQQGNGRLQAVIDQLKTQIERYKKDIKDSHLEVQNKQKAYNDVILMVNTDFKKYTEERDYLKQEIGNLKYDIAQLTRQNQMLKADNQKLMNNTTDRTRADSLHAPYRNAKTNYTDHMKISHTCTKVTRPQCTCCPYQEL